MTLRELYSELCNKEKHKKVEMIGVYEGPDVAIVPDYADEYLETHGDYEVTRYGYNSEQKVLIVELNMEK